MGQADANSTTGTRANGGLRADATRNLNLVLAGARQAIADLGLDVGYHEVARYAGVGVGTVYRRFPDREQLLEAVLLDVLTEMREHAAGALANPDAWAGFAEFFAELAARFTDNAGLSDSIKDRGGRQVDAQRRALLRDIRQITERASAEGVLRPGIDWRDVVAAASSLPRSGRCALNINVTEARRARVLDTILTGLRRVP